MDENLINDYNKTNFSELSNENTTELNSTNLTHYGEIHHESHLESQTTTKVISMFNESEEVDMRAVFKLFKDKIIENAANLNGSDEIEHAVKHAELVALNNTLDDIILEITVKKQEGAAAKNISEKI